MEHLEGSIMPKRNLVEEMRELGKLRTAVMMEKCSIKSELVICPKPRRRNLRQCRDLTDVKDGMELSDIIFGKASPPSYPCSPPTRSSNPLIQDARFCEQRLQQSPNFGARIEGKDIVADRSRRTQSILTMA